MRRKDAFDVDALHFAPFVLFPSPFPKNEFSKAVKLQTILNELMHKVQYSTVQYSTVQYSTVQYRQFSIHKVLLVLPNSFFALFAKITG